MDAAKGVAIVDGQQMPLSRATIPVMDLGFLRGFAVFDTVRAEAGSVQHLDLHLDRFEHSCRATALDPPDRAVLRAEVERVAEAVGGDAVIRFTLTGSGLRLVMGWPPEPGRFHAPVRCATGPHVDLPFIGGVPKHHSRAAWMVAVQRSGVDEVLLVDADGRFTEGTTCAVLAVIDGVLWTAPHDGRILKSTTCLDVLDRARELQIPIRREGPPAAGPWDALYIASTTRKLAPVAELDGEPTPGWDPVGRRLAGF